MTFLERVAGLSVGLGEVRLRWEGEVAIVELAHAAARNALSPRMMVRLGEVVGEIGAARAVILTGEGGAFCAGGDLGAVHEHLLAPGVATQMQVFMAATCDALAALPAVVIAAVEGTALGGGAELLTACDVVIAAPSAKIGFVQASMGVSPGFGGGRRLVERVGPHRAVDLLTRARPLSAEEAMHFGVVDEIAEDPLGRAHARALEAVWLPAQAALAVKALVRRLSAGDPNVEHDTFVSLWGGPEHVAALDRFRRR